MKIEKLNENKIKITLNSEDLLARNIDVKSFIYNTPASQDLFWDVMREAEKECGFTVEESMVYVEASATASGTFTLIVTKTANTLNQSTLRIPHKNQNYKLKRKHTSKSLNNSLYSFDNFDDICSFCETSNIDEFGKNTLFELDSKYYLLATNIPNSNILEYSKKEQNMDILLARISEYGKVIIKDNALKIIDAKFINRKK